MALNASFGYVCQLVNANGENVERFCRVLTMEIATADGHVAIGEYHRVVGCRVQLDLKHRSRKVDRVVDDAMD